MFTHSPLTTSSKSYEIMKRLIQSYANSIQIIYQTNWNVFEVVSHICHAKVVEYNHIKTSTLNANVWFENKKFKFCTILELDPYFSLLLEIIMLTCALFLSFAAIIFASCMQRKKQTTNKMFREKKNRHTHTIGC